MKCAEAEPLPTKTDLLMHGKIGDAQLEAILQDTLVASFPIALKSNFCKFIKMMYFFSFSAHKATIHNKARFPVLYR